MNPLKRACLTAVVGLLLLTPLWGADPAVYKSALQAGLSLYDDDKLDRAEAKFLEAERAATTDIQRAKARYHLGLIYYKEKKWGTALSSFETADKLDPRTTFTKNTAQYRQKLATIRANMSVGAKPGGAAARAPQTADALRGAVIKALLSENKGGLWDFAGLLNNDQKSAIQNRIHKAAKDSLYFYVVTVALKAGGRTLSLFTDQVFRERGFKKGEVLFVVSESGVYGKSADLANATLNASIQAARKAFMTSFGDGIAFLIGDLQDRVNRSRSKSATATLIIVLVILGVVGVIIFGIFSARKKKAEAFENKFAEAVKLESEILEQMDIARTKVNLGSDAHLKDLMRRTESRFDEAHNALEQLKAERSRMDVGRADAITGLLRGLLSDLEQLKSGEAPGSASFGAATYPSASGQPAATAESSNGNCFFCSNPVDSQTAERARITMGDQEQWALMCQYCADYRRRTGQMPKVLGRTYQGQSVHWKDDPTYTPPAQAQPMQQQSGFFGGGGGMGLFDLWMLSNIFSHSSHDRTIFVDRDSGSRGAGFSYDVDESRGRSAGSSYRHEASVDADERRAAPGMDFHSKDRS
ncbi:MAG: hypothetical protein HYR55_10590 [Acidobacteria bacterium]|nr:hypothetical protein [Acidobacteriota bacterium]MBI3654924.1 hypothetical protein [Acidobacteriota bacterium]